MAAAQSATRAVGSARPHHSAMAGDGEGLTTAQRVEHKSPPLRHLLYAPSAASGDPNLGPAGENGRGTVGNGALEGSNVNPVTELVQLILTQRAFELNSQSVKAADEVLRTAGQLRSF